MFIPEQDAKTYERLAIGNAAIAGVCLVLLLLLPLVDAYLAAFMMLLAPAWLGGVAVAIISGHLALAKLWHMPGQPVGCGAGGRLRASRAAPARHWLRVEPPLVGWASA